MSVGHSTSPNFKSHIKTNDYYRAAIDSAKNDLTPNGFHRRGMNTLKALEGISYDGKQDFVEFFQQDGKVYTKINGAIDENRTFWAQNGYGTNAQYAIIQYARSNNSFSEEPILDSERKVIAIKEELVNAEKTMCRDFQNKLNWYY